MTVLDTQWAEALCTALNASQAYRDAAADWRGSLVLALTNESKERLVQAVFLDLYQGTCRGARQATDIDLQQADYVLEATAAVWKEILAGTLSPVAALMQGKLRLRRGSLAVLARFAGAASALVECARQVGGSFPQA